MKFCSLVKLPLKPGNAKFSDRRRSQGHHFNTNMYPFTQDDDGCFNCVAGMEVLLHYLLESCHIVKTHGYFYYKFSMGCVLGVVGWILVSIIL